MTTTAGDTAAGPIFFNPFDPGFRIDPYSTYRRLREEDPVHQSLIGAYILSRFDDCLALLRDPRSSSDARNSLFFEEAVRQGTIPEGDPILSGGRPFLFLDPPDHTRLRGLVSKAFTPRVVEGLRPRIQEVVDDLLTAAAAKGEIEVIEDLAYPLPVRIISEMLGVPAEDHERFKGWSQELARSLDPDFTSDAEVLKRRLQVVQDFRAYFLDLFEQRRRSPRDDLLTALVEAEEAGDKLSEDELVTTCILLLVAGHETTVNLIGNGALALLRHPDQLARFRDDPSVTRSGVEELLRYDPPVQMTIRTMLEDYEVGGVTVGKGQQVVALIGSANRDPRQFADPESLDVGRSDNRHIAFGFGIHFCLGAPLARAEGQLALKTLVTRFEGLELATDSPPYKQNLVLRGLESLPVRFRDVRPG